MVFKRGAAALTLRRLGLLGPAVFFLFPSLWAPSPPLEMRVPAACGPLCREGGHTFLLGTDLLGRDMLSLLLYGGFYTLSQAMAGVFLGVGISVGLCGLWRSAPFFLRGFLVTATDLWTSFPHFLTVWILSRALAGRLPYFFAVSFAAGILYAPFFFRRFLAWGQAFSHRPYVRAAKALGLPPVLIFFRHMLPAAAEVFLPQIFLTAGRILAILVALSLLGLGAPVDSVTLSGLFRQAAEGFESAPWIFWDTFVTTAALIFWCFAAGRSFMRQPADFYGFGAADSSPRKGALRRKKHLLRRPPF